MSLTPLPPRAITFSATARGDLESLIALRIEAMRESLERIGRFDPVRARERFLVGYSLEHTRHIELNGKRVGFFVVKKEADTMLLEHLYVRPSFQGNGIGSLVLAQIFTEADSKALTVRVGALRQSASNRFYMRHGFQLIEQAEFDNYYIRPSKNAL